MRPEDVSYLIKIFIEGLLKIHHLVTPTSFWIGFVVIGGFCIALCLSDYFTAVSENNK